MIPAESWITLARLVRPRGRSGEIVAVSLGSPPDRFREVERVFLFPPPSRAQQATPFQIEKVWEHQGRLVLKFRGIDSISEAEGWRGGEVRIPAGERKPPPDGEYYLSDLDGCAVVEQASGRRIGSVCGWQETGGVILLEVNKDTGGEVLIPFARSICVEIDMPARTIKVALPEGLLDLNRP